MKKKLLSAILFLLVAIPVCAEGVYVMVPEWSEYCPPDYLNARPARGLIDSMKLGEYNKYWYERKAQFEQQISYCSTMDQVNKISCFQQVRNAETNKTNMHNERVRIEQVEADRRERRDAAESFADSFKNWSK